MARKLEIVVNNTLTSDTPRGFCERHEVEPRKQCAGPCGQKKLRAAFHRSRVTKDGRARICKSCKSERNHSHYIEHIEWFRDRDAAIPEQVKRARRAARKIKLVGMCEACGIHPATCRHHPNYAEPLKIDLWCGGCHNAWHETHDPAFEEGEQPVLKLRPPPRWREDEQRKAA